MSSMNEQIKTIMTADEDGSKLVAFAREQGEKLYKYRLTTSQIRNIFTEARKIEATRPREDAVRRLNMLKPKLAYQKKRNDKVAPLSEVLSKAIDEVIEARDDEKERNKRFNKFMDLFEAILAYHKAAGRR